MNFKENKAIYLQIAERICDEILLDTYKEEERIPSVREYASIVEVNFNTVMRSFEYLQSSDIIFNKRGIGYFVSEGAKSKIISLRKIQFMEHEINDFFKEIYVLEIPFEEIASMYKHYVKQQKNK
ncbi:GntR family transcriptional regulator [Paludibacter sp.]|nr:MAG: GntR family transcriptional regulator [Bacteroidales bacterium 36-12]